MNLREKNYEEILSEKISQEYWSLEDAVFLVTGESRKIKNVVTYEKALQAIKTGLLNAKFEFEEPDFEFHDGGMDGAMRNFLRDEYHTAIQENNFEKASNFYIKPRVFVDWCIKNKIHSTCSDKLFQFFNYDYWLSQEFWEFNQAVLILFSEGNPPLPSQIVNVFEVSELCNLQAKKLAQDLLDTKTRRIDEEWLYWKIKRSDGVEEWASCYPNSYEDFLKERIFLSRNALFRIVKKHEKIFLYIPKSLLDKALKIIDKHDVDKIHSNAAVEHLLKMIRENSLKLTLNKICTPQEFLKTLAKLPNESGERNMKILMEIALNEIRGAGLSEEDSRRQSDIKEIRARFENLNEYSFLFKKDQELNKINFLSSYGDEDRGRLVDFIEWARGHKITIPRWLIEDGSEGSKITESIDAAAHPSKAPEAEVILRETNHKICVMALEALKSDKMCDLGIDSVERLWNLIISLCEDDLDGFDDLHDSKKKADKERLNIIRKEIKKNLSLKELFVNRDDGKLLDTDYFFCWKTIESMKQKKDRKRDGNDPIEFRFGSFKNKLSSFKKIISEKS